MYCISSPMKRTILQYCTSQRSSVAYRVRQPHQLIFFCYTDPGHSDVPKGPLQKHLRTAGSKKERQAKRHKQGPLRTASRKEQKNV
eukprot:1152930-Pelagomonas_calceolata.AAC.1